MQFAFAYNDRYISEVAARVHFVHFSNHITRVHYWWRSCVDQRQPWDPYATSYSITGDAFNFTEANMLANLIVMSNSYSVLRFRKKHIYCSLRFTDYLTNNRIFRGWKSVTTAVDKIR